MGTTTNIVTSSIFILLAISIGLATGTYVQSQQTAKDQVETNNQLLESNQRTLDEIQKSIEENHQETRTFNQCLADAFIGVASQERLDSCINQQIEG